MNYSKGVKPQLEKLLQSDEAIPFFLCAFTGKAGMLKCVTPVEFEKHKGEKIVLAQV